MGAVEGGEERLAVCDVAWLDACKFARLEASFGALTDINGGDVGVCGICSGGIVEYVFSLREVKGAGDDGDGEGGPVRNGAEEMRSDMGSRGRGIFGGGSGGESLSSPIL